MHEWTFRLRRCIVVFPVFAEDIDITIIIVTIAPRCLGPS
jgi:hypothetical protein